MNIVAIKNKTKARWQDNRLKRRSSKLNRRKQKTNSLNKSNLDGRKIDLITAVWFQREGANSLAGNIFNLLTESPFFWSKNCGSHPEFELWRPVWAFRLKTSFARFSIRCLCSSINGHELHEEFCILIQFEFKETWNLLVFKGSTFCQLTSVNFC